MFSECHQGGGVGVKTSQTCSLVVFQIKASRADKTKKEKENGFVR